MKKKGIFSKTANGISFIVSFMILILSTGFVAVTYLQDHGQHGHYINDPIHLIGLVVVVISAASAWLSITWRRRK